MFSPGTRQRREKEKAAGREREGPGAETHRPGSQKDGEKQVDAGRWAGGAAAGTGEPVIGQKRGRRKP